MALDETQPDPLPTLLVSAFTSGGKMALTFCCNAKSGSDSYQIVLNFVHSHLK